MDMNTLVYLTYIPTRCHSVDHFLNERWGVGPYDMKTQYFISILFYDSFGKALLFHHCLSLGNVKVFSPPDHDVIILPNSKIANEKVINLTEPDNKMKVKVTIGVDYNTDIQQAKKIMLDVANKHNDVINTEDRDPFVRLVDFGDSSINLKLYTWVYHLDDQWRVGGEMREEIFEAFKKEGIDIPFPQRVVHMQGYGDNMPSKSG